MREIISEVHMPHELSLLGVYVSPLFLEIPAGVAGAVITALLLNRLGWSRFFANPPWVFVSFVAIYICLLDILLGKAALL